MAVPAAWKIRREVWRILGRLRYAAMQVMPSKQVISYKGLRVPLNRSGMNAEIVRAMLRNYYEDPEIKGIVRVVKAGDRVLELGAGLGIVTALAARAAMPEGRVLSFEANSEVLEDTASFLKEHDIANAKLEHAVLVPGNEARRDFHLASSFAVGSLLQGSGRRVREIISVPAVSISSVFAEFRPDILVCDIEGGEAELIPAMDASGLRAVVIELHPDRLKEVEISKIYKHLQSFGLEPDPVSPGGTVVIFSR